MDSHKINKDPCFKIVPVPGRKQYDIPVSVQRILQLAQNLSDDDYEVLSMELLKTDKLDKDRLIRLKNLLIAEQKRRFYGRSVKGGSNAGCNQEIGGSGLPSTVDPKPPEYRPTLGLPSTKVPLIVRGDLAAVAEVVALDTEKVIDISHKPVSGDISIVDLHGRVIFWAYIKHSTEDVCRLNTARTGLTQEKLEMGFSLPEVQGMLNVILEGKTVAGFALKNDLISLGYTRKTLPANMKRCELQDYFVDINNQPISLANLGIHFLGTNPQAKSHSSLKDARMTAICYKRMEQMKTAGKDKFFCEGFNFYRSSNRSSKSAAGWDRCTCGFKLNKMNQIKKSIEWDSLEDPNYTDWE